MPDTPFTREDAGRILIRKPILDGYEYAVIVGPMGSLCGYVRIPDSHPWFDKGYGSSFCGHDGCYEHTPAAIIDVHGGLTFAGRPIGIEAGHWFGFDCSHSGDLVPGANFLPLGDVWRDEMYVEQNCSDLAHQLAVLA
jgi:hypothetical protein